MVFCVASGGACWWAVRACEQRRGGNREERTMSGERVRFDDLASGSAGRGWKLIDVDPGEDEAGRS